MKGIGIQLPDANECIVMAQRILLSQPDVFIAMLDLAGDRNVRQHARLKNPGSSSAGSGAASPPSTQIESAARMQKILAGQANLPMVADGKVIGVGGKLFAGVQKGGTPGAVQSSFLVATKNTVTDVAVKGMGGEGVKGVVLLTTTQLSNYMRTNHTLLKNHLSATMSSQNDAQATLVWLEEHASLVAEDFLSQTKNGSFDLYFTKLFTDIGAGLVSVIQDDRVATGPGTTLLDPAQHGKLSLLHIDPNIGETERRITAIAMMLTPLGAPQRLGNVIGDFRNWDWSLAHGAKTALDVLATTGDVFVVGKAFSVSLQGIVKGTAAFTAKEASEVILNVTVNGEKATIRGINLRIEARLFSTIPNIERVVNGITYVDHAAGRMMKRGIPFSAVEYALKYGTRVPDKLPGKINYLVPGGGRNGQHGLFVVVEEATGKVVTVEKRSSNFLISN